MRARRVELDRGTLRIRERRGNERDIGCRSLSNARDYITSRPLEGGTGRFFVRRAADVPRAESVTRIRVAESPPQGGLRRPSTGNSGIYSKGSSALGPRIGGVRWVFPVG